MLLTYAEYEDMGYTSIPDALFERYEAMAEGEAQKYTMGGLNAQNITETNKRGLCELADLLYGDATGGFTGPVSSFSNGRYSESYAVGPARTVDEMVVNLIGLYFTPDQLSRWI